jgi:hypothetical protein
MLIILIWQNIVLYPVNIYNYFVLIKKKNLFSPQKKRWQRGRILGIDGAVNWDWKWSWGKDLILDILSLSSESFRYGCAVSTQVDAQQLTVALIFTQLIYLFTFFTYQRSYVPSTVVNKTESLPLKKLTFGTEGWWGKLNKYLKSSMPSPTWIILILCVRS